MINALVIRTKVLWLRVPCSRPCRVRRISVDGGTARTCCCAAVVFLLVADRFLQWWHPATPAPDPALRWAADGGGVWTHGGGAVVVHCYGVEVLRIWEIRVLRGSGS